MISKIEPLSLRKVFATLLNGCRKHSRIWKISNSWCERRVPVGANYIEANESLSKRDFLMRIKICRKEAKESRYWLRLVGAGDDATVEKDRLDLLKEATELTNIFGAILRKSE